MNEEFTIWVTRKVFHKAEKELQVTFLRVQTCQGDDFAPVGITTHSEFIYNYLKGLLNEELKGGV